MITETTRRSGTRYQPWRADAACQDADPALFFPEHGQSARKAKAICVGCPVRLPCLAAAERWGVWGGLTERERMGRRRAGSSRFRGVTWHQPKGLWQARAVADGRRVYLGLFDTEEEAALAVAKAEAPGTQPRKAAA